MRYIKTKTIQNIDSSNPLQ